MRPSLIGDWPHLHRTTRPARACRQHARGAGGDCREWPGRSVAALPARPFRRPARAARQARKAASAPARLIMPRQNGISRFQIRQPHPRLSRGNGSAEKAAVVSPSGLPHRRSGRACHLSLTAPDTHPHRRPRCPFGLRQAQVELSECDRKRQRTGFGLASPCPGPAAFPREGAGRITYTVINVKCKPH